MSEATAEYRIPVYSVAVDSRDRASALDLARAKMTSWTELADKARVPEHSVPFMVGMSGGKPLIVNNYLFFAGDDWITCIGYPLSPDGAAEYDLNSFVMAADLVGDYMAAGKKGGGRESLDMFAVAPSLPAEAVRDLGGEISEEDRFYILPASACVPGPLRRLVRRAEAVLNVDETTEFTGAHRRLWSEILTKADMRPNVREMYAKTGRLMQRYVPGLTLFNAWDAEGNLAASLLMDSSPEKFCSYIIGAHSRRHYSAYATDLLFARLLEKARALGKEYIHLGLGVNEGILRFKKKWGGQEDLPFVMASWKHSTEAVDIKDTVGDFFENLAKAGGAGMSKQQIFNAMPPQRPYAMLWQLEKNGRISWIGGSAHFFYYSFTMHFEKLFEEVDSVILEGPMDEESMAWFAASGQARRPGDPDILSMFTKRELDYLKSVAQGPQNKFIRRLQGEKQPKPIDVEYYLANYRPWYSFFSIWTAFLERQGWKQSVDLDAWNLAHERGKAVVAMETHEEQMGSLESIPPERILAFFRQCKKWPALSRNNMRSYLLGDLGGMHGTSTEFPTRGVRGVFSVRDVRFTERMMPFVEQGRSITFVGSAHMLGMRALLRDAGVKVTKVFPGRWHRFKCGLYKKLHGDKCDFD